MEGYSPSLSSPGRPLCLQAELAPGTRGPSSPVSPGGTFLPVPSQHLRSSHIAGPSPGKHCRLLLFLPCNNIFPAQNNIGKVIRLLLLFQAGLPPLPQPRQIPPVPRVTSAQGAFPFPGFNSPESSTLPRSIHPQHPLPPGWGPIEANPKHRCSRMGVPWERQRKARRAPGCAATLLVNAAAKCSFPSYVSHCWTSKRKEKSSLN